MSHTLLLGLRRLTSNSFRVRPLVISLFNTASLHSFTDVPDARHRGIGTVDEGIDGLREAGFLNDNDACTLAASKSSKPSSHSKAHSSPDSHDVSSNNVYAIDTQYKKLALNILGMSEANNHQPDQLSSFTDQTMELVNGDFVPSPSKWMKPSFSAMIRSPNVHIRSVYPLDASFNKQSRHCYTTIHSLIGLEQPEEIDFHLLSSCDSTEQSLYATKDLEDDLDAAYSDDQQLNVPSLY